jgi:nucleotide-binding universal stress UspA family protein
VVEREERGFEPEVAALMGAFGLPRWREIVLGGVTAHVLAHMPLPVLMAH